MTNKSPSPFVSPASPLRFASLLCDLALAWRLLTIIPLPFIPDEVHPAPGRAAAFFPLIGLVLGVILAGLSWLLALILPSGLTAALLLAAWAGLTGLLHLDGFIDCCDGLLPPRDPARRLEIMKFGVVGVVVLLLVKFNALAALPDLYRSLVLIVTPVLARWAMVWAMVRYPLARTEGLSVLFKTGLGWRQVILASVVALGVSLLLGWRGLVLLAASWLVATLIARLAMARLGGLTGDVYGAIGELVESVLLVMAIFISI